MHMLYWTTFLMKPVTFWWTPSYFDELHYLLMKSHHFITNPNNHRKGAGWLPYVVRPSDSKRWKGSERGNTIQEEGSCCCLSASAHRVLAAARGEKALRGGGKIVQVGGFYCCLHHVSSPRSSDSKRWKGNEETSLLVILGCTARLPPFLYVYNFIVIFIHQNCT